ncbi:hypothetical protein CVU37_05585 [candidate division BRC1 bacterium HGW-BRC1-1]|nr:MAG: hypothetical protein CVU37_05585 [candidate division BRC1 bacterium HGW-BRC1-1]
MKRIQLFATVLAACLTAPLFAQQTTEIIVESFPDGKNATGFSKTNGNWNESVNKSMAAGLTASKSVYKTLEMPGSAMFKADVPEDGKYDVFVTYPSSGNASGVIYTITHAAGKTVVNQDQYGTGNDPATPANTWISLGTYDFKKDVPASVEITDPNTKIAPDSNEPNQRIYADAIKLTPNAGTPMVAAVSTVSGSVAAASAPAAVAISGTASVPGAPALASATTATAEGLPGLSAAAPGKDLPSLSAASPAQNLPGLSAASPAQNLPGLAAAAVPQTATATTVADAAPAAPATALPGLSAASSAPSSELPGLNAAAPSAGVPALTALPTSPAPTPDAGPPSLPLLNAPKPVTMPTASTPAPAPPMIAAVPVPTPVLGVEGAADIGWSYDIGAAQAVAEKKDSKIFVFLTAPNNRMGIKYETEFFTNPAVRAQMDRFVPLRLNFPTNSHYAYKLGAMGGGKIAVIDRSETVLLNIDQIPASPEELVKMLEGVK